jgi:mRNA interferase RelE/StbE
MKIVIRKSAQKALARMNSKMRTQFFTCFDRIAAGDISKLDIKKLTGREGYRLRIGQYRAIFTKDYELLDVLDVGPRGDIYS